MKAILSCIFLFSHLWAAAQTKGGAIFFRMTCTNVPHAAGAFQRLSPDSISGFSNSFYGFGSDGFYTWDRIRAGFNATIAGQGPSSKGVKYAEPVIGSAHITLGYVVCGNERWDLSPQAGGGISGIAFSRYDKVASVISNLHSDYIIRPSVDVGLNLDWRVYRFKESIFETYYIMGFRVGYRYSGSSGEWKSRHDDHIFTTTGNFTNNAYYAAISLGVGVFKSHQR